MDFRFFLCDFYEVQVSMHASRFQDVLLHPHYMDPAEATSEGKCGTKRQTFKIFFLFVPMMVNSRRTSGFVVTRVPLEFDKILKHHISVLEAFYLSS